MQRAPVYRFGPSVSAERLLTYRANWLRCRRFADAGSDVSGYVDYWAEECRVMASALIGSGC